MVAITLNIACRARLALAISAFSLFAHAGCAWATDSADVLIRGGQVFDGTGTPGRIADVAVKGDRIVAVGNLKQWRAKHIVDASGMVVAPGFINMLSQATYDLLRDGRSQSDIRQGVTLEMLGEGLTPGPVSPSMKANTQAMMTRRGIQDADWTTQAEYMQVLERRGVSPNIASFVGAANARMMIIGSENRKATAAELEAMQDIIRNAMKDGAFGVTSALAYAPAAYADTAELTALAKVAAPWDGMYISHLRDEGEHLPESVDELISIARDAGVKAEVYHFKILGLQGLPKLNAAIGAIERARQSGLRVSADMYPYTASATGFDVAMPLWVQAGGQDAWFARLKDSATRTRVADEMRNPPPGTSSLLIAAGSPENVLILGTRTEALHHVVGKTLGQIAHERGTPPEETVIDLVVEDGSRLQVAYFMIPEEGLRRVLGLPWVSFGSDGGSMTVDGSVNGLVHPREYGAFARMLGHYVRDERALPLADAIHRLSGLPAANLGLTDRGLAKVGFFADLVVFDAHKIADTSTFTDPHHYAIGMRDVFVNGMQVLANEEHTGAKPGRFIRNPRSDGGAPH